MMDRKTQKKAALMAFATTGIALLIGIAINGRYHGDFFQFYIEGAVALRHDARLLYDIPTQTTFGHALVPESADALLLPTMPPQISLLFAPLAKMGYVHAMLAWGAVTYVIYAVCCYLLWLACPNLRQHVANVALAAAAFPGLAALVLAGQTAIVALAAFTATFYCLRSNRLFAAGLAIGVVAYKPQLGLVAAGVFLLTGTWRVVAGALITGIGQYAIACWWYKKIVVLDFLVNLRRLPSLGTAIYEPNEYLMHSLRSFWQMLMPPPWAFVLYVATAAIVLIACLRVWKSSAPLALRFSAFLLATVLIDPHIYIYDLIVLAPALLLLTDWLLSQPTIDTRLSVLVCVVYGSSLLPRAAHSYLSTFAPAAALFSIAATVLLLGHIYRVQERHEADSFA